MKERRYRKSYRVVTDVDPKTGKVRDRAVYAGAYYRFPAGSPAPRRRALHLAAPVAAFWLLAVAYLRFGRATSRCMYALVPFMASLLPGVYGLLGLCSLAAAPGRMTVVQKENGPGRLVRACLGCGVLAGIGAVGCAVFLSLSGRWAEGWAEPLLTAAASACAWIAFSLARRDYRALAEERDADTPAGV